MSYAPMTAPPPPPQQMMAPAGFGGRFVAIMVDGLLLSVPMGILALIAQALNPGAVQNGLFINLISIVSTWTYETLFVASSMMATPGKRLMGYRVTTVEGRRLSLANALGRCVARIPSALLLAIGYLVALFDPARRTLHDRLAGTLVVKGDLSKSVSNTF